MPHYGILHEYRFDDINDVRGSEVYGVNDEKLGTIDDVVFDHSTGDIRYIVLKTGGLFSRKQILVPANRIDSYGNQADKFYADLDKERLEMLPEFEEGALKSENDWSVYEREYENRLNDGAVMYNKDTGRIVTPPVEEVAATRRKPLSEEDRRSLDRDFTPQRMGKEDDYLGVGGSTSEKIMLQPEKASMGGRADVTSAARGSEVEMPVENQSAPVNNLREPGTYNPEVSSTRRQAPREVMSPVGSELDIPVETPGARLGSRWTGFQDRLHSRRDKIVEDCPFCGSQEKVA